LADFADAVKRKVYDERFQFPRVATGFERPAPTGRARRFPGRRRRQTINAADPLAEPPQGVAATTGGGSPRRSRTGARYGVRLAFRRDPASNRSGIKDAVAATPDTLLAPGSPNNTH
jgi:hypothetical protein